MKPGYLDVQIEPTITITYTARPTTKVLDASVVITTLQQTLIRTSTVAPQTVVTSLFSTTVTTSIAVTSTIVTTTTSTETALIVSRTSSYAACASNNFLAQRSGLPIINIFNAGAGQRSIFFTQPASSAYDCCVACITFGTCASSGFLEGTCYLFENKSNTCGAQSSSSGFYVSSADAEYAFAVSNGYCGYLYDGGVVT
jgi:hypothetical protein